MYPKTAAHRIIINNTFKKIEILFLEMRIDLFIFTFQSRENYIPKYSEVFLEINSFVANLAMLKNLNQCGLEFTEEGLNMSSLIYSVREELRCL